MPANNRAQRQEAKTQARTAASQGTYSRANTQAMRSAGVNRNVINSIRSSAPVAIGTTTGNSNYGGTTTSYTSPSGQPMSAAQVANATRPSYDNIKNIKEGLALGGNQYLSAKEAMQISKATGKDYDKVLQKGMDKGMSISGGAIRKSNQAYASSRQGIWSSLMGDVFGKDFASKAFPDALGMFRNQKPGKKQAFSGSTVQMDGQTLPVWSPKTKGTTNPLTIKDTKTDSTPDPAPTPDQELTPDQAPTPTPEPVLPEQPLGPGGLLGGDGGGRSATGLSRKKSRQQSLRIRGGGTNLFNRTNPYQAALNS